MVNKLNYQLLNSNLDYQIRLNSNLITLINKTDYLITAVRNLHFKAVTGVCNECSTPYPCRTIQVLGGK